MMKDNLMNRKFYIVVIVLMIMVLATSCQTKDSSDSGNTQSKHENVMTEQEKKDQEIKDLLVSNFWEGGIQALTLYEFFEDGTGFWYNGCCEFEEMSMAEFEYKVENGKLDINLKPMSGGNERRYTCEIAFEEKDRPSYFDDFDRENLEQKDILFYDENLEEDYAEVCEEGFKGYCPFYFQTGKEYNKHLHPNYLDKKAEWKNTLIDYVENYVDKNMNIGYDLIYIDDNDIPELVEYGNCEAVGCRIGIVSGDTVNVKQFSRLGYAYIEKGNVINNCDGLMGYYHDTVYEIKDGKLNLILDGKYHDLNDVPTQDENGNFVYEYYIGDERVTKEIYEGKVEELIPANKIASNPEWDKYKSLNAIKKEIIFK